MRDTSTVLGFHSDYEQYVMVRHSFVEYLTLLRKNAELFANRSYLGEVVHDQIVHNVNRRLRSFFAEFRAFLDNTESKLSRRYGSDSEQLRAFKEACSCQFDTSFPYRLISQLRNYALHVNLPLNAMSLASGEGEYDPEDPDTHNQLAVEVNRDDLLGARFDWRRDVKSGLQNLPQKFELNPLIKEAMFCLERIHLALVCIKLSEEKQAAKRIIALSKEIPEPGIPIVLRINGPSEDIINGMTLHAQEEEDAQEGRLGQIATHIGWVPFQMAQEILSLPDPEEMSQHENFFLDIVVHTPDGEKISLPF